MNTIIIYKSNTGFTKNYAKWLSAALSCEAVPLEELKKISLESYDTLVFGGWLFAGTIKGLKEFKESLLSFQGKKAIFATGATPSNSPEIAQIMNNCLTQEEHKNIATFYLNGGLSYENMGFVHKSMMKMMCRVMKNQHGADSEQYKTISQSFDGTDQSEIDPIIRYLKG